MGKQKRIVLTIVENVEAARRPQTHEYIFQEVINKTRALGNCLVRGPDWVGNPAERQSAQRLDPGSPLHRGDDLLAVAIPARHLQLKQVLTSDVAHTISRTCWWQIGDHIVYDAQRQC